MKLCNFDRKVRLLILFFALNYLYLGKKKSKMKTSGVGDEVENSYQVMVKR